MMSEDEINRMLEELSRDGAEDEEDEDLTDEEMEKLLDELEPDVADESDDPDGEAEEEKPE